MAEPLSGVRTGPFVVGERITLTDPKNRRHSVLLAEGGTFHTTKGGVSHDELIGGPEGVVVTSVGGTAYLALRPLLSDYVYRLEQAFRADGFAGAFHVLRSGGGAMTAAIAAP